MKKTKSILIVIGGVVLLWNLYWFAKTRVFNDAEFESNIVFINIGFVTVIAYFSAISFLIIKWLKKRR
jgi:hypothetical protein